ncbi:DNA helicase [Gammaproteobacteria bacterium]|nr:DNA helicase [Gammaproteobacteria bacterium]
MKLSVPVYRLKHQAKILSRSESIPLHKALDHVAGLEGYSAWSLLAAELSAAAPASVLLARFSPGDIVLLGARPGHGKTQLSLELMVAAMKSGRLGVFFTLEYNLADILTLFHRIEENPAAFRDQFEFDAADAISAEYIMKRLASAPAGTLVVIDYLQLLDQKRQNPELVVQVAALKSFARERGLTLIFVAQIDRSFDPSAGVCPGLDDVRLPNPLDLALFDKACFLHDGELKISTSG